MIADLAGAITATTPDASSDFGAIATILIILGLAVVAVRGAAARAGHERLVYVVGLVAGAALGLWLAAELGTSRALGLALGLGASVVGAPALDWVTGRIRGGRADVVVEAAPATDPQAVARELARLRPPHDPEGEA